MSADEETPARLILSESATLAKSAVNGLAARGWADLQKREEAEEWLRRGLELQRKAFNDPGWWTVCDPKGESQRKYYDQILLAHEYLRRVSAGEDSDSAAAALNMTPEDQEMAHTLNFFIPNGLLTLVEAAKTEKENRQAEIAKHEEILGEAFRCFERGLELDPSNVELLGSLADCYCGGWGVGEDEEKELALLRRAAEMGEPAAQTALGYHISGGLGGGPDDEVAMYWLRKAVEQGDELAMKAIRRLGS